MNFQFSSASERWTGGVPKGWAEEIARIAKFGCVLRVAKFFFHIGRESLVEKCCVFPSFFF